MGLHRRREITVRRVGAYRRLLIGLAGVSLLLTIAFLAIAPTNRFDYPPLPCGSPAVWYVNGQPRGVDTVAPFKSAHSDQGLIHPQYCRDLVNQRLTWAAMSGTASIGLLLTSATITRRSRSSRVWFTPLAA